MISFSEAAIASLIIISGVFISALVYYLIEEYWFNRPASEERIRKFKKNPQLHKRITEHLEQGHVITNIALNEIFFNNKKAKKENKKRNERQRVIKEQKSFLENRGYLNHKN